MKANETGQPAWLRCDSGVWTCVLLIQNAGWEWMTTAQGKVFCFSLDFSGTTLSALGQGRETSARVSALEADMGLEMRREAICVLGLLLLCELE